MNSTIGNRREALKAAVNLIETWFISPTEWVAFKSKTKKGTIRNQPRRPDTFWLELFDGDTPKIMEGDLKHFFQIFGLARVSWKWPDLAACICNVRSSATSEPMKDIPKLVAELRECNRRHCRPTSAASKIAVFSKPKAKVFIWDEKARASARSRDQQRGLHSPDDNYPGFYEACERALEDERNAPDFRGAVDEFDREFRSGNGVMASLIVQKYPSIS